MSVGDDRDLALRACDGDQGAFAGLAQRFLGFMVYTERGIRLPGADRDDLRQACLLGLYEATLVFDGARPFAPLAMACIRRRAVDALVAAIRVRHKALNEAASLDAPISETSDLADVIPLYAPSPHDRVVQAEELRALVAAVRGLTDMERRALAAILNGESYSGNKPLDNAAQRARRKLRAQMSTQDAKA